MDPWEMRKAPFWSPSRAWSLAILVVEIWSTSRLAGPYRFEHETAGYALAPSILGVLCIWFPQQLGRFKGYVSMGRYVDRETPEELLYYAGWAALVLPFCLWMLMNWVAG
jgi:hypothetical protein